MLPISRNVINLGVDGTRLGAQTSIIESEVDD